MISYKKYYAEQLLQLALALSLLRVDPNLSYFDWADWETAQVSGTDIGILELRATIPINEYPHANRKQYIPLIEDLARFDHNHYLNRNPYGVHAYLLNVQSSTKENCTTTVQPQQQEQNSTAAPTATAPTDTITLNELTSPEFNANFDINDLFLNSELFNSESASQNIFEQTLADLNDYNEELNNFPIQNLPLKDELPEIMLNTHHLLPPFEIKRERASSSTTDAENTNYSSTALNANEVFNDDSDGDLYQRSSIIDWKDYLDIKSEIKEEDEETEQAHVGETSHVQECKQEEEYESDSNVSGSPTITDLTQEVSDFFLLFVLFIGKLISPYGNGIRVRVICFTLMVKVVSKLSLANRFAR